MVLALSLAPWNLCFKGDRHYESFHIIIINLDLFLKEIIAFELQF